MVTINIEEFSGYTEEEIENFLIIQNEFHFVVKVPKEGVVFFSDHNELAWEYAIAAYIGQRLREISKDFEYSEPSMNTPGNFSFIFKTQKIAELSEILLLASGIFGNSENSEPIDFHSEVGDFIQNSKNFELACPDFVETYYDYYTPEDDD